MQQTERIYLSFLTFIYLVAGSTVPHSSIDDVDHSARPTHSFLPILRLVDLSLDKWGSKIAVSRKTQNSIGDQASAPNTINFTGSVQKSFLSEAPANLVSFVAAASQSSNRFFLVFATCVFVLLCLAAIMYMFESEEDGEFEDKSIRFDQSGLDHFDILTLALPIGSEQKLDTPPRARCVCGNLLIADSLFCRMCGKKQSVVGEESESLIKTATSDTDGSWVRAYREATGPRKAALELLFKCQIISNQEFLHSRVSQEHINECVWVGNFMLQQKSMEAWESLWQEAQQTFEDSVTQCFTARTDARSFGPVPASGVPMLDCQSARRLEDGFSFTEDPDDPYSTRNHALGSSDGFQSPSLGDGSPVFSPQTEDRQMRGRPERPVGEFPERGLSPIISRCRAIISAPPQEGVPEQNPGVVRSSSVATTVTAMPASPSRESSIVHISPMMPNREPVEVSREYPPQPQGWPVAEHSRQPIDVSQQQASTSSEPLSAPARPDSRTFIQMDTRIQGRPVARPVLLFPIDQAQSVPYRSAVKQQGGTRSGDTSPVGSQSTMTQGSLLPSSRINHAV